MVFKNSFFSSDVFSRTFVWHPTKIRFIFKLKLLIYLFKSSTIQAGFHPGNFSSFDWTTWKFWDELDKLNIYGVGPDKTLIVGKSVDNHVSYVSNLIQAAHRHNIGVHPYTFKNDNLLFDYKFSSENEYEKFIKLEVDGFFSDFPETLVRHLVNRFILIFYNHFIL
ncbi:unnamed protein product [Oikopleura dioica]|uniref:glycerophosphodiester phosphodiesterase n=1 Tax=Oikopleura dioica TaxID=34765 RepID=E4X5T2_OIKDI|nr:unnamed protein product [Oikopleura dioica]